MKLKKLIPELASGIIDAGFDTNPKKIESDCIPKIKSGADLLVISPEDSGKTSTIVIGIIQQLKKAVEEVPRAIVVTSSKEKAFEMEEQFKYWERIQIFGLLLCLTMEYCSTRKT